MSSEPQSFFVPGYGISRHVIQSQIRYYCGPGAFARPYTLHVSLARVRDMISLVEQLFSRIRQGRDGFLVTTTGPPLTKVSFNRVKWSSVTSRLINGQEQLEDIRRASKAYEEQLAARDSQGAEDPNQPIVIDQNQRGRTSGSG